MALAYTIEKTKSKLILTTVQDNVASFQVDTLSLSFTPLVFHIS